MKERPEAGKGINYVTSWNFTKVTGKHHCQGFVLITLHPSKLKLHKIDTLSEVFPVNFSKDLGIPIF